MEIKINGNKALGLSIPPVIPWQNVNSIKPTRQADYETNDNCVEEVQEITYQQSDCCVPFESFVQPVTLIMSNETEDSGYRLPTDPLITVSGSNRIVRRFVAKGQRKGSIKELWSTDDYRISISGLIVGEENYSNIKRILTYCLARESVRIICPYLNEAFDVNRLAIESFDFPATKGEKNYQFVIRGYSDENYLILDKNV